MRDISIASRRQVMTAIGAATSLALTGSAVRAGGGKDPESSSSTQNIDNKPPKKKAKKLDVIYTQKYLSRVKKKDLKTAIKANETGHSVVIEGFSKTGSTMIFKMLLINRWRTILLLEELSSKPKRKDRKAILKTHTKNAENHVKYGAESIEDILIEDSPEMKKARAWLPLIRAWKNNPMEGTKTAKVKKATN